VPLKNSVAKTLLAACFLILIATVSQAQQEYIVQPGENLYRIASRFETSVDTLKRLNGLASNLIHPGDRLIIDRVENPETEDSLSSEVGYVYQTQKTWHRVRSRETLAAIARRYGLTVTRLKSLNHLSGNLIHPGDRLLVEEKQVRVPAVSEPVLEVARNVPAADLAPEKPSGWLDDLNLNPTVSCLLENALEFLGAPYRLGGLSRLGVDCSGLVKKAFDSVGIEVPRTARTQYNIGKPVSLEEILPGDLLFFATRAARYPTHVAIYLGNGLVLHASSGSRRVVVDNFENSRYLQSRFIGARRILSGGEEVEAELVPRE